jgi:hypothetical protein
MACWLGVQKCMQQRKEMFPLSAKNNNKDNISLFSAIGILALMRL